MRAESTAPETDRARGRTEAGPRKKTDSECADHRSSPGDRHAAPRVQGAETVELGQHVQATGSQRLSGQHSKQRSGG